MEGTPRLDNTLVQVLGHHENWLDRRHLKTLAWMVVASSSLSTSVSRPGSPMCTAELCVLRAPCVG
jgi:hypothetical protein